MDKVTLKFIADILYVKAIICLEEYEAILDASTMRCLDDIVDRMLRDEYSSYVSARNERKIVNG